MIFKGARSAWIVGMARTGTTWMRELLEAHPDTVLLKRTDVLPLDEGDESGLLQFCTDLGVLHVLTLMRDRNPGKMILEKTPWHCKDLEKLFRIVPDAKVVHMTRHPYETIQSGMEALPYTFEQLVFLYQKEVRVTKPFRGHPQVLWVSYEALCEEPARQLFRVLKHVGLDAESAPMLLKAVPPKPPRVNTLSLNQRAFIDQAIGDAHEHRCM